jgi:LysR family transcriptional regulator, transcriptional activator of nhaA
MEWLNYHHLLYFWTVARTGSISAASEELRLASPTISDQIRKLEDNLSQDLLRRSGRKLVLTDRGRIAMRYADEIFSLGQEFTSTMKETANGSAVKILRRDRRCFTEDHRVSIDRAGLAPGHACPSDLP